MEKRNDLETVPEGASKVTRVWITEDNANYRNAVIQEINEGKGMVCDGEFATCEEMLAALERPDKPDVILLDIRLPGLSGLEAISLTKAKAPATQIIMVTSLDSQEKVFKCLSAGASGYLLKTANGDICEAINQVMHGGAPMSPAVARAVLNFFTKLGPVPEDYNLSPREKMIMELMVKGLIKKEISDHLGLSYHTVDGCLRRVYRKLHVHNSAAAVAKVLREGLC